MPPKSGDPLRKVTLNLFDADVEDMGHYYGHGWSEVVRDLVHRHLQARRITTAQAEIEQDIEEADIG